MTPATPAHPLTSDWPGLDGKCNNKHKITVHCRPKAPMPRAKSVSRVIKGEFHQHPVVKVVQNEPGVLAGVKALEI